MTHKIWIVTWKNRGHKDMTVWVCNDEEAARYMASHLIASSDEVTEVDVLEYEIDLTQVKSVRIRMMEMAA